MVWEELERLARDYLPQWHISRESPDVGGVIALIYADLMEKTLKQYQEIPRRAMHEILHIAGIRPACASPARTVLVLETDASAKEGVEIRKGSRFLAHSEEFEEPVIFCAEQEILAVYANLTEILQISQKNRAIYASPHGASFFPCRIFDMGKSSGPAAGSLNGQEQALTNIYDEELVISHPGILEKPVRIPRASLGGDGVRYVDARIQAYGLEIVPQIVYDGNQELKPGHALIFGRELLEYKECYIGHDPVFGQGGARITLAFSLHFHIYSMMPAEAKEEWKIIKRKPKETPNPVPVYVDEVSYSYYNGVGWKRLEIQGGMTDIFSQESEACHAGRLCQLSFCCPRDWQPVIAGGRELRCLRIQVVRAGQGYRMDAEYHYPALENLRLSYSHGASGILPQKVASRQGTLENELVKKGRFGDQMRGIPIFRPFPYDGESVLLGFDRVFPSGNISLYLLLEEQENGVGTGIRYTYSTKYGFEPLEAVDGTKRLSRSGTIAFWLPENAGLLEIEGRECFWIRLEISGVEAEKMPVSGLCLKRVYLNGLNACNYKWSEGKEYYLDEPVPFLECAVRGEQILEAEVLVNEKDTLSEDEMLQMLAGPWGKEGRIHMERDYRGRISEFFVKWDEVESFECEQKTSRGYILDRQEKKIKFGDGRNWRIPECTNGTAFYIRLKTCDGAKGNLKPMQEFHPDIRQAFLKKAYQPGHGAGGCDAEPKSRMEQRGNFLRNSRNRLVSGKDYISEIQTFSDQIAKVKLIREASGREKFVVLMKDYRDGPASYWQMHPFLREAVRKKQALAEEEIVIEKPLFVQVSVEVWGSCPGQETLEAKQRILRRLRYFFEPEGFWPIGKLPDRMELEAMLRAIDEDVSIRYFNAVFQYQDQDGFHTWNLDHKMNIPEAVCINGKHKVHLTAAQGGESIAGRGQAV